MASDQKIRSGEVATRQSGVGKEDEKTTCGQQTPETHLVWTLEGERCACLCFKNAARATRLSRKIAARQARSQAHAAAAAAAHLGQRLQHHRGQGVEEGAVFREERMARDEVQWCGHLRV